MLVGTVGDRLNVAPIVPVIDGVEERVVLREGKLVGDTEAVPLGSALNVSECVR